MMNKMKNSKNGWCLDRLLFSLETSIGLDEISLALGKNADIVKTTYLLPKAQGTKYWDDSYSPRSGRVVVNILIRNVLFLFNDLHSINYLHSHGFIVRW